MAQPYKHPASGIYYIRRKVPPELRSSIGREYKRSLRTHDSALAKSLFAAAWAAADEYFNQVRHQASGGPALDDQLIRDIALQWMYGQIDKTEATRAFAYHLVEGSSRLIENGKALVEVESYVTLGEAIDEGIEFDLPALALPHVQKAFRDRNMPLPHRQSGEFKRVENTFTALLLTLSEWAMARHDGKVAMRPDFPVRPQVGAGDKSPPRSGGPTLLEAFKSYSRERLLNDGDNRSTRKTLGSYEGFIRRFIELFGNLPIGEVNRETINVYREQLSRMPSRGIGSRDLTAKELIAKAQAEGLPLLTKATIRNRLLALSAVFSHAVRLGKLNENPVQASGIARAAATAAGKDANRSRRAKAYSKDELVAIFASQVFTSPDERPPKRRFGAAWYWLPLLCYYTGARREELAQLRVSDVRTSDNGIPYVTILDADDDDGARGVKTANSRRSIPLHTDLVERGFLQYVGKLAADGQVFPLLKANPEGYFGANFGKHWAKYLREVVRLHSSANPMHGFRHSFKTLCRSAGIPEDVHDAMTGHDGKSRVARGYGSMPLDVMAAELTKFPKVSDL